MRLYFTRLILFSVLIISACSKSKQPGPIDNGSKSIPKLGIVSGNNQTAKVGFSPADTIRVKFTGDGLNPKNYYVEFRGSGCNSDLPITIIFSDNGIATSYYKLAGNIGPQTFQATLIENGSNKRLDSVTFNFTGIAQTTGLNYAACTPFTAPLTFCKTGSGRLFSTFDITGNISLRYSDDDGVSWFPVKVPGTNHRFRAVTSDGKSGVMVDGGNEGIYYSADNGETWQVQSNVPFKGKEYGSMTYTPTGKMFYIVHFGNTYYSEDNGATWTTLNLPNGTYWTVQEGPAGEFYVYRDNDGIYKSTDKGQTWNLLPGVVKGSSSFDGMFAFYVDNKTGYIYKSAQRPSNQLWISTDGGSNYKTYLSSIPTLANVINKFNDVIYFQSGGGIYKIDAPNHAVKLFSDIPASIDNSFVVSNNNNLIIPGGSSIFIIK